MNRKMLDERNLKVCEIMLGVMAFMMLFTAALAVGGFNSVSKPMCVLFVVIAGATMLVNRYCEVLKERISNETLIEKRRDESKRYVVDFDDTEDQNQAIS